MQIVDHEDEGTRSAIDSRKIRQPAKALSGGREARHPRCEPDERFQLEVTQRRSASGTRFLDSRRELSSDGGCIVLMDTGLSLDDLADGPERDAVPVR